MYWALSNSKLSPPLYFFGWERGLSVGPSVTRAISALPLELNPRENRHETEGGNGAGDSSIDVVRSSASDGAFRDGMAEQLRERSRATAPGEMG